MIDAFVSDGTLKVHFTHGESYEKTLVRGGNKGTIKD